VRHPESGIESIAPSVDGLVLPQRTIKIALHRSTSVPLPLRPLRESEVRVLIFILKQGLVEQNAILSGILQRTLRCAMYPRSEHY